MYAQAGAGTSSDAAHDAAKEENEVEAVLANICATFLWLQNPARGRAGYGAVQARSSSVAGARAPASDRKVDRGRG